MYVYDWPSPPSPVFHVESRKDQCSIPSCTCCTLLTWCVWYRTRSTWSPVLVTCVSDDTRMIGSCPSRDVSTMQYLLSTCLDDVAFWMQSNRLLLNTEQDGAAVVCYCTPLRVGSDQVKPTSSARDIGNYIDADLSGRSHHILTTSAADSNFVGASRRLPINHQ